MSWKQLRTPRHDELRRLLKQRRLAAGLTQKQLAAKLGWDQTTVSDIEVGSHRVTVVELIEMAAAIGFDAPAAVRRVIAKTKTETKTETRSTETPD